MSHTEEVEEDGKVDYELNPLSVVELTVSRGMKVADVKSSMLTQMNLKNIKKEELVFANQKSGKISEFFEDSTKCDEIDQDREYTMVYHVPNQTEQTQIVEFNFFKHAKRNARSYTVDALEKSAPRLFALTPETTIMDVKRVVIEKLRGIFDEVPETDEDLN